MRFLNKTLTYFLVALLAAVAFAPLTFATQKKVPLVIETVGNQNFLVYRNTSGFVVLSADTLSYLLDTTTGSTQGIPPAAWLYKRPKGLMSTELVNPGEKFPEKICASYWARSDADSGTSVYTFMYSDSTAGTYSAAGSATTNEYTGTTRARVYASYPFEPKAYAMLTQRVSSATDSNLVFETKFWACDD